MPIYEYRCERGHSFDVLQRMSDDPVTSCTACGRSVQRVLQPVAVHFKGSGFYSTDYGKKGSKASDSDGSGDGAKKDKGESKKTESVGASSGSKSDSTSSSSKSASKSSG